MLIAMNIDTRGVRIDHVERFRGGGGIRIFLLLRRVMVASRIGARQPMAAGASGTEDENSLLNGIRASLVASAAVASSRDQPNKRARSTTAYTVTSTRGLGDEDGISAAPRSFVVWGGAAA